MNTVLRGVARQIVPAILTRLGAIAAAYLVTQGVPPDMAGKLATATGVFLGLAFDSVMILYYGETE